MTDLSKFIFASCALALAGCTQPPNAPQQIGCPGDGSKFKIMFTNYGPDFSKLDRLSIYNRQGNSLLISIEERDMDPEKVYGVAHQVCQGERQPDSIRGQDLTLAD